MKIELGALRIHIVSDGGFKLDGGTMFGVVPKTLWNRVIPADAENRIQMGTNWNARFESLYNPPDVDGGFSIDVGKLSAIQRL